MINRCLSILVILFIIIVNKTLAQNNLYPEEPKLMSYQMSLNYDEEIKPLLHPFYVYVDNWRKNIFVIDSKGRIIVYDKNYLPLFTLDKRWGIIAPVCVVTDPKGNLYVLQYKGGGVTEILKFNKALFLERIYNIPDDKLALKIAVDESERIYVVLHSKSNRNENKVAVWDKEGKEIADINPKEDGNPVPIENIKIDSKGRIFLINLVDSKIYVFDKNYQLLSKFGEKGGITGKLSNPKSVGVDEKRDLVYIVDYMRHVVNVFSLKTSAKYLFEFGGYGNAEGWFVFPNDVDVDWEGRVYVADTFNSRIQILSPYEGTEEVKIPINRVIILSKNRPFLIWRY